MLPCALLDPLTKLCTTPASARAGSALGCPTSAGAAAAATILKDVVQPARTFWWSARSSRWCTAISGTRSTSATPRSAFSMWPLRWEPPRARFAANNRLLDQSLEDVRMHGPQAVLSGRCIRVPSIPVCGRVLPFRRLALCVSHPWGASWAPQGTSQWCAAARSPPPTRPPHLTPSANGVVSDARSYLSVHRDTAWRHRREADGACGHRRRQQCC